MAIYKNGENGLIRIAGGTLYADLPIGSEIKYTGSTPPLGFLAEDGSTYSATDYPDLYAVLGTTTLPNNQGYIIKALQIGVPADFAPVDEVTSGNMHAVTSNAVANYALKILFEGVAPDNGIDTGINVNAGVKGRTLIVIGSGQWDAGNSTGSGVYMVRCGYDVNNYNVTPVIEDNIHHTFKLAFSISSNGNLVISSVSSTWYVRIISNKN